MMKLIERVAASRETLQRKRLEHKIDDSEAEKERLRVENRSLREAVGREHDDMQHLISAVGRIGDDRRRSRARKIGAIAAAAAGAYVLGARAGRERYEQIARRWGRLGMHARRSTAEAKRELDGMRHQAAVKAKRDEVSMQASGVNSHTAGPA
jgi:hypothetical protein